MIKPNATRTPPRVASPAPDAASRSVGRRTQRTAGNRAQTGGQLREVHQGTSIELLECDTSKVVCEIFKEDVSHRAQARRYLWEFFD